MIRRLYVPRRKDSSSEDVNSQLLSLPRSLSPSCFPFFSPSPLGDLWCYISFSSVHPPPTLVSHPCLYLNAHPIGYSFWRSVSCCGPHRPIRGYIHINEVRVLAVGI